MDIQNIFALRIIIWDSLFWLHRRPYICYKHDWRVINDKIRLNVSQLENVSQILNSEFKNHTTIPTYDFVPNKVQRSHHQDAKLTNWGKLPLGISTSCLSLFTNFRFPLRLRRESFRISTAASSKVAPDSCSRACKTWFNSIVMWYCFKTQMRKLSLKSLQIWNHRYDFVTDPHFTTSRHVKWEHISLI